MAEATVALLSPASLPKVLGEALLPGVRVVALLNRSGLLLGCAGDASTASSLAAIVSMLWLGHEKCDGLGNMGCLLVECEHGRLAVKAVGSFILACCSDSTVVCGRPGKRCALCRLLTHVRPPCGRSLGCSRPRYWRCTTICKPLSPRSLELRSRYAHRSLSSCVRPACVCATVAMGTSVYT